MNFKPEELLRKLHNGDELPGLIVVYGEDSYYRSKIAGAMADYVFGDTPEEDRQLASFAKDTELGVLEAEINSYPFFCGRSLVLITDAKLLGKAESENAKKQQERLGAILTNLPDYCVVFINVPKMDGRTKFFKDLGKVGAVVNCEPIKTYKVDEWLRQKAESLGGVLSRDAEQMIMEYLEPLDVAPLQLLEQELEKLALYAGERKRWGREDVEAVFAELPEVGSFALTNAVGEHKLKQVLELLAVEKKKNTPIIKLCGGISYQLRKMLQIKELLARGYNNDQIGDALNMKFASIRNKNIAQCHRYEYKALQEALLEVAQLNIDLRVGGRQYERLEEILIKLIN